MANNNDLARKLGHIQALLETIVEFPDGCPSGICYMAFQMKGVDLDTYQGYINGLQRAGLITITGHHILRATPKVQALLKG